ncbi:CPII coat sec24 protein [Auricularia subglabra TFB-10046 SS5]|nr:CPII coat sec24 protein [Auricularia subglabra TFB-10046 SS5]
MAASSAPRTKRRQYAAEQLQAYSAPEPAPYDNIYPASVPGHVPAQGPAPMFTPGLANVDANFAAQQQMQPQPGYYENQLAGQFAHMGLDHRPLQLHTINLLATLPNPAELQIPPPKMPLPATATISQEPTANADPTYMRSTLGAVPTTGGLLVKTKLPFALVLSPNRSGDDVPLVTDTVIARCRRCRSFINPYVQFVDGGQRWKCCLCGLANEVPQLFDWDATTNSPADRYARQELHHAVVEYVAPTEYMVRPPQPLVYVFLVDVSHAAVQSGMLATATRTILENLDRIPNGEDRTKVAIIGFDVSLYFFSLTAEATDVNMLVVSDVDDVFLPQPSDLLVNLTEARTAVETLLGRMQSLFAENDSLGSALGPALQAGFKMISSMGGKMVVLSASLPTVGTGALKSREDAKLLGTPKESSLLQAGNSWYKTFAIECSRATVSVDMFLFGSAYQDVASLSVLPHYTSGSTFFYPGFNAARTEDAVKFATEFGGFLASPVGLEALMRLRTSRGLHPAGFHGNFFLRSTDLLAMPAVPQDQSYMIELEIDETINDPFVVLQCSLLYTTALGERRIRATTLALPTTANISDVYAAADQGAIAAYLANKAVERVQTHKLEDARDGISNRVTAILEAYKNTMTGGAASGQLAIAQNLSMMPLLALGLLKHVALRHSAQIPSDLRAYAHTLLTTLPIQRLIPYLHPTFYSLHNMPPECGTIGEHGVILPPAHPLSSEPLERHGLYLIEDGQTIFLWVGRDAVPQLVMDVFDLPAYAALHGGKYTLPLLDNPFSQRVNTVVNAVREMYRGVYYPMLYIVKEDGEPSLRLWALSALIQDRGDQTPSYQQWLGQLRDKIAGSSY